MISALHLLWIIPLSTTLGMLFTAIVVANRDNRHR